jgi:hypothetical protein
MPSRLRRSGLGSHEASALRCACGELSYADSLMSRLQPLPRSACDSARCRRLTQACDTRPRGCCRRRRGRRRVVGLVIVRSEAPPRTIARRFGVRLPRRWWPLPVPGQVRRPQGDAAPRHGHRRLREPRPQPPRRDRGRLPLRRQPLPARPPALRAAAEPGARAHVGALPRAREALELVVRRRCS